MNPKKKRNKPYVPRQVTNIGGLSLIARRQLRSVAMPDERQTNVVLSYHVAIDAISGGYAEPCHFDTLVYAANLARILGDAGIGEGYEDQIHPALAGLLRCKQRYLKVGKFGFDGEGLTALLVLAELHEAQIRIATHGEIEDAIAEMHRRIASGNHFEIEEVE